ncbi:MAG TPA: ABC transporter ATP-binding protein [Thermoanaerobaculia bacterium]
MTRFLWGYFRRYGAWALVAAVTVLAYGGATVGLLTVFRAILAEVIRADEGALGSLAMPGSGEDEDEASIGFDVDLTAMTDGVFSELRTVLGVTEENVVWTLPVIFVLVFLVRSLAAFANGYIFQIIGLGATNDLRNDLYDRILHQSSRFYAQHPSGELVSRVGNDVGVMQNAISSRLLDLFEQSVTLVLLVWFLLSTHFNLALACLVVAPAVFYPVVRFGQGMRRASRRSQERLADLSNLVAEAVRGHRVVKAFGMEGFELARFREATRRHLRVRLRAQLLSYASGPVVETLAVLGGGAFLVYAGYTVRRGELRPSDVMTFLTALVMLYDPVRKLNKVNIILQEALAAAHRVRDVMAIARDVEERPGAATLTEEDLLASAVAVTYEGVDFGYEDDAVLRGVDLEIRTGEVVALVGASGAGKSTLVNLLPRFFDPDAGRVTLGGHDLRDLTLASLRAQIGIVTQDTVLFNDTVRANVAYGRRDLPLERVREAAAAAYADEFVMALPAGYDTVIGESGLKLSGGQRQRLAIARALLKNPPLLILDEATSHLDTESEALVQKALYNLMTGRTALVIAHRLSTVKRADRIVVMEAGKLVEEGTHDELLKYGGVYHRLYELQFRDL